MNYTSIVSQSKNKEILELFGKCIPFLVLIYIFFNPYPHVTAIKEISFYGVLLVLLPLIILKKKDFDLRTPLSIPFLWFVLWSFCGLFFALNKGNSIHDFYAHLVKYIIIFYLLFNFFATKERLLILIWTIIISTAIYSLGMLIYYYLILGNDISTKLGVFMIEIPSNIVGISTLFGMLLSLYQLTNETVAYRKIILIFCLCSITIGTLAIQSRGTILALFVSLILSFSKNKKILLLFSLFLALVILVTPVKNKMTPGTIMAKIQGDDRIDIWYNYFEIIKDHPIIGIGFGMQTTYDENLLKHYQARTPDRHRTAVLYKAPHNLLVDIAVRVGIVGLLLFLNLIFAFARMGWRVIRFGKDDLIRHWGVCFLVTFLAFLIQGQFENVMSGPPAIVLYAIMAMMTILWHMNEQIGESRIRG
jgi:O-antigen ligase